MNVVTTGRTITVAMGTEVSNVAVGRVTVIGGGVGVGDDGVAVGVGVGDGVAVGVGVGVGPVPVIVIRPLGVEAGVCELKSGSKKIKLSGSGFQTNGLVAPGLPSTLTILRLNNVPDPFNCVMLSNEKTDMRRVLIVPGPLLIMPAETFQ